MKGVMNYQYTPYLIPLLLAVAVTVTVMLLTWRRREATPGMWEAWLLMLGAAFWSLMYAHELSTPDIAWQILFAKLQYFGIASIPQLWLLLVLDYTRKPARRSSPLIWALTAAGGITILLAWTNEFHSLIWRQLSQIQVESALILSIQHGPLFYLYVAFAYVCLGSGAVILLKTFIEAPALLRRQIFILLMAALVPWMGNLSYILKVNPYPYLDLTPIAFTITSLVGAYGLTRYGLLEVIPLARDRVFENLTDAVFVLDSHGRILDLNPAADRMVHQAGEITIPLLGANRQATIPQMLGRPISHKIPGWKAIEPEIEAAGEGIFELPMPISGKPHVFEVRISTIHAPHSDTTCRLAVLRDISERKLAEKEMRLARDMAEQASNAKSTFLATMSHELRSPLTVIIGYSDMMAHEARAEGQERIAWRLDQVLASSQHLLRLVNDILDLSRIEAGHMQLNPMVFPVAGLLEEIRAFGEPLVSQNHNTLQTHIPDDLGEMNSDPTRVRQILINLIANAAKFTQNGTITIGADREFFAGKDWLEFEVRDTGIGMTMEQQQMVFEPFHQVDPSNTRHYGGAGLGLTISRRLCDMLGGEITLDSAPQQGSVFHVRLPACTNGSLSD